MSKRPTTTAPRPDVYDIITNRIILSLESGVAPWKKGWAAPGTAPRNYRSKRAYQGINALLLGMLPYEQPYFLTFQQARELGGCVRKGEKGMPVVFYSVQERENEAGDKKKIPFLRYSTVFNIAQIDGIEWKLPELPVRQHSPVEAAEAIVRGFQDAPRVRHHGSQPYYTTSTDTVVMPQPEDFHTAEDYYLTLFHELGHATGHQKRLDRKTLTEKAAFGSEVYAKEELVAELAAAFLGNHAGFDFDRILPTTASYLDSWLQALRNDKTLIVSAASQAQKAVNHILGITPDVATDTAEASA